MQPQKVYCAIRQPLNNAILEKQDVVSEKAPQGVFCTRANGTSITLFCYGRSIGETHYSIADIPKPTHSIKSPLSLGDVYLLQHF